MDSSKVHGGAEECSSSESGWTAYIASPIHETYDENSSSSSERKGYKIYQNEHGEDGESDESMASDASSGPSHQGRGFGGFKNVQGKDTRKDSRKEHSKKTEKMKSIKEETGFKGKSLINKALSRGKTKKNK